MWLGSVNLHRYEYREFFYVVVSQLMSGISQGLNVRLVDSTDTMLNTCGPEVDKL
jgi:hypothetical protein